MNWQDDTQPLRRYLLGEAAAAEQEQIEERLLFDQDYVEQLLIVEEDLLDGYVTGELTAHERERCETYLLATPARRRKLRTAEILHRHLTNNPLPEERAELAEQREAARVASPAWLQSLWQGVAQPAWKWAAALLIAGFGLWLGLRLMPGAGVSKGTDTLRAAYLEERPLAARIAGLNYAQHSVRLGAEAGSREPVKGDQLKLRLAEMYLLEAVEREKNAASLHALGQFYLAGKNFDAAIKQFEAALNDDPQQTQQSLPLRNDLAVALMERAVVRRGENPEAAQVLEDFAKSRDQLEAALKLNAAAPEVHFNLALWYQRQRLWARAAEAWRQYLNLDASSAWAAEARHYQQIAVAEAQQQGAVKTKEQLLKEFLLAQQEHDDDRAWSVLSHNREAITGKLIWWQLTGAFLEAVASGRNEEVERMRHALDYAGKLEAQRAGDRFTADLAAFYRASSAAQRQVLAQAHQAANQGLSFGHQNNIKPAVEFYRQAKTLFVQAGDIWEAGFATYWIAFFEAQDNKTPESIAQLKELVQTAERAHYFWLAAQAWSSLGGLKLMLTESSQGIEHTSRALALSQKIGDAYGVQKNLAQLALQYKYLDHPQDSLAVLQPCLEQAAQYWSGDRQMYRSFSTVAQVFSFQQYYAAAADYENEALRIATAARLAPYNIAVALTNLGGIHAQLQNFTQARSFMERGLETAQSISDTQIPKAFATLRSGHLRRQTGAWQEALSLYDQTITLHENLQYPAMLYDAHKGKFLCYRSLRNDSAAKPELEAALEIAEKYRTNILQEKYRNTFFDAEQDIYDLAIDFARTSARNDELAFNYAEQSRARTLLNLLERKTTPRLATKATGAQPLPLAEIQRRMPEQTQILQYAVLENKLLIWVVSPAQVIVVERALDQRELQARLQRYWELLAQISGNQKALRQEATALYEILISPLEAAKLLDAQKLIYLVPDKILNYLPFNALRSPTGEYLLNRYPVVFAPSATVAVRCTEIARLRSNTKDELVLSIGNPSFARPQFSLPDLPMAEREARTIAGFYRRALLLLNKQASESRVRRELPNADVLHIASHYVVDDRAPLSSQLLLAKEASETQNADGVLQAGEIYGLHLPHTRLVVLSACRSGIEYFYRGEGMIGMSRTFLAAGVPLVIASLWPVDSDATTELMISFHKHRQQSGVSSIEALRRAQQEMLNHPEPRWRHPAYWASFAAIGGAVSF